MHTLWAYPRLVLFFTGYTLCRCRQYCLTIRRKPTVKIRHLTDASNVFASFVFGYYKFYLSFTQLYDNHYGNVSK
jgi:hypothetical protein